MDPHTQEPAIINTEQHGAVLVLPDDWWVIPLEPVAERNKSIKNLIEKQVGKLDVDVRLRKDMRAQLEDVTEAAASKGGVLYAISLMEAGDYPIAATLTIYREDTELESVRVRLIMQGAGAVASELEFSPVYRTLTVESGPGELDAEELKQLVAQYWLEPHDSHGVLHAVFSTPHLEVQDAMLAMFDAIVGSITTDGIEPEMSGSD